MSGQTISSAREATNIHGMILILAAVMPVMAIISLVPVMPLLGREFGAVPGAKALVPIALTIPALCIALFSPLAGWLSDRVGRKMLLILALLGYAAIGVVPYFLTDLKQIIGARIGLGIFEAVIMTVATAMIGDYFKGAAREKWIGIQVAAISVAAIFLIAIGGALGDALGSRGPFLLYLLAIPIALLVAMILFEPEVIEKTSGLKGSIPWKKLTPLLLITLGVGIFFYTVVVKLGDILFLSGEVTPGVIGAVGAGLNIGNVVGTVLFMKLKKSSGPKLLAMGMALFAIGYTGMGLSGSFPMTVVFAIISTFGAGLLLPTMLTWVMSILPANVRGRGTGFWTGMFFLGQFVAPLVAVALYKPVGGLSNVLLVYGGIAALLMVIAIISSRGAEGLTKAH